MAAEIEVDFSGAGRDTARWFDTYLGAVRTWRAFQSDAEITERLIDKGLDASKAWLLIQAAKVMDG